VSEWVRSEGHYASGSASSGAHLVSESARSVVLQDWMLIMRQNMQDELLIMLWNLGDLIRNALHWVNCSVCALFLSLSLSSLSVFEEFELFGLRCVL
jgi:hypothetical protein